jgi:medium-chain acyl-[acyl-carrier-protein] hydrolase
MRLFCLPHAGGGSTAFHSWSAFLPASIQTCSVLLPGRETRFSEPLYTQIDPLLDVMNRELRPWLDIPYAVFGHSMGALLAFEWVRKLRYDGHPMPTWLFLSGRCAPDMPTCAKPLHLLSDGEFVTELSRLYNGIDEALLLDAELMDVFMPVLRADIEIVESYRYHEADPLDCPITVFCGKQDGSVSWDQLLAWRRHTRSQFSMQIFPGGHFYPHLPLLKAIDAILSRVCL